MSTYSSVDCSEVHGTRREVWTDQGMVASVDLLCDYANRFLLVADILENRRVYPFSPSVEAPAAKSCAIQVGIGEQGTTVGQAISYSVSRVTVTYDSSQTDSLFAQSIEPTAEFRIEDHKQFRWGYDALIPWDPANGAPLMEKEAPGKLIKGLNLIQEHYNVNSLDARLISGVGEVNEEEYTSPILGLTFEAESLLFNPPSLRQTINTAGEVTWTVRTSWTYKKNGWNKYWRAATQEYGFIYHYASDDPYKSYTPSDISDLLA